MQINWDGAKAHSTIMLEPFKIKIKFTQKTVYTIQKNTWNPSRKSQASISEDKIEAYADAEWLAKQWKIFQSLDELFKIERRIRKELGGSQ
jgi:hypothetical protein